MIIKIESDVLSLVTPNYQTVCMLKLKQIITFTGLVPITEKDQ